MDGFTIGNAWDILRLTDIAGATFQQVRDNSAIWQSATPRWISAIKPGEYVV